MQLVILGMHRSGTSGVTRLLNMAGAYFGPPGIATDANEENPKGFWERRDVRALCDGLLQGAGFDWFRLGGFEPSAIPDDLRQVQAEAFAHVLDDLNAHQPWVVKEPRLCLLMPVLEHLLDSAVFVHVSRDPIEVARSVHHRNNLPMAGAVALWETYTLSALSASAGRPRAHVRHEEVMADPVGTLNRLIADLEALGVTGLVAPDPEAITDFIVPSLHRQRSDRSNREHHLNADQLHLADLLDRNPLPEVLPPLSAGGADALADLVRFDDEIVARKQAELDQRRAQAETRRLTAETQRLERAIERMEATLDHERTRRAELGASALESLDRAERDIRAMTAGRTATAAAYLTAARRTVTPGVSRTDPTPFSRALAGVEKGRRRIRGMTADLPSTSVRTTTPGIAEDQADPPSKPETPIQRTRPRTPSSDRPKVAVLAWDVGHNPLGRANVLAEVLSGDYEVELWGAQFERYGSRIWAPLRDIPTPVNVFPGRPFPDHLETMEQVAATIDADALWVSKPRLPSFLLGALTKQLRNRPLVLDIDDHELAFFDVDEGLDIRSLSPRRGDKSLILPFERDWTRACEPLVGGADLLTVSNVALQQRFGGTIVPHARDEDVFDPGVVDRGAARHRLGIGPNERVLLFGGTPRLHKGIMEILTALEKLGDRRYRLMVFGTREFDEMRPQIGDLARWLLPLPYQPFSALPEVVAAADLACILQNPDHPVSAYQLPAKLTDALAMGVPVLLRETPPLRPIIEAGAVAALQPEDDLADAIGAVFEDAETTSERVDAGRRLFLDTMSYGAVRHQIRPVFDSLISDPPALSADLRALIEVPTELFAGQTSSSREPQALIPKRQPGPDTKPIDPGQTFDVVVFWKQNDTGIYGRRQEMIVDQLVRSPRVGTVVHFDNPITPEQLQRTWRDAASPTHQGRLVVRSTLARVAGRANRPGLESRTWLYGGSRTRRLGLPARSDYVDHVTRALAKKGIGERPWVLWAYPTNPDLPLLIDRLRPDVVLADVVDDNRTWYSPGTAEHDRIDQNYRDVLSRSDLVIANCEPAAAAMKEFAPEVHVVPNGLELDPPTVTAKIDVRAFGSPIIGYVGNLSSRIDIDLLDALARARPRWQFVFVGSTHLDPAILRLDEHANVHFLGVVHHHQARAIMANFDVALIPHIDNEMTQSMNPLKAFVYASVGVPVVSTPIANLGELGGLISIASGVDGFVTAIEAELTKPRTSVDRARLEPHSWGSRLKSVLDLIDGIGRGDSPLGPNN